MTAEETTRSLVDGEDGLFWKQLPVGLPGLGDGGITAIPFPGEYFKILLGQLFGYGLISPL
jgi:hypothetical protein